MHPTERAAPAALFNAGSKQRGQDRDDGDDDQQLDQREGEDGGQR